MHYGRLRLVPLVGALSSCHASQGIPQSHVDVPSPSPVASSTADDNPPVPPLPIAPKLPAGSYTAAVLSGENVGFATWVVSDDGRIRATKQHESALQIDETEPTTELVFSLGGAETPSADMIVDACPSGACRSMAGLHGRLTLPGEREREIRLQWYGDRAEPRSTCVMVSIDDGTPLAVVLDTILRSPAGPWLAASLGDLDGDDTTDVAFVAMGVGSCGGEDRPECPVLWVEVLPSSTDAVWETDARGTIARSADFERMTKKLGEDPSTDGVRWTGKVRAGEYVVEASGPKGSLGWTVAQRDARWSVRPR